MSAPLRVVQGGKPAAPSSPNRPPPPHNLAAEEQVLVHALIAEPARARANVARARAVGLAPEDFFALENGRLWEAICALADAPDGEVSIVSLGEWLRSRDWLRKVGGTVEAPNNALARLEVLALHVPIEGTIRSHARIVVELAAVRRIQAEAHLIAAEPYGALDAAAYIASAPERLARVGGRGVQAGVKRFRDHLSESWAALNAAPGVRLGYPTGLAPFDEALGGLFGQEVLLVSGQEKAGKSTLVGQLLAGMSEIPFTREQPDGSQKTLRRGALIIALDAAKQTDWAERVAAGQACVDLERFRLGTATDEDRAALSHAIDHVSTLPILVDGEHVATVGQMGARIRAVRDDLASEGIELSAVAFDYAQLFRGEGDNRETQISSAMRGIISLAAQPDLRGIAWIVIAQVRPDGLLAQCTALAQMCDAWVHLEVDEEPVPHTWTTPRGIETVDAHRARIHRRRARRGRMGKRAAPIECWIAYAFTRFFT